MQHAIVLGSSMIITLFSLGFVAPEQGCSELTCFAPLCLKYGELQINNTEVVSKSYPNFWKDLEKGGFIISPLSGSNN